MPQACLFSLSRGYEKDAVLARAAHLDKEKPAVRDLLTAGVVRVTGVEPACLAALEPKSSASANSAISAFSHILRVYLKNHSHTLQKQ